MAPFDEDDLSPQGFALRAHLLSQADLRLTLEHVNPVIDETLDRLNTLSDKITVADQLVLRALVARAILKTAAAWWADLMDTAAVEHTFEALLSLATDPPPEIRGKTWLDPTIAGAANDAGPPYHTKEAAIALLAEHGFTELVGESENGDCGPRVYFCRPGAERNEHGWPIETAQADCWGDKGWTATRPAAKH